MPSVTSGTPSAVKPTSVSVWMPGSIGSGVERGYTRSACRRSMRCSRVAMDACRPASPGVASAASRYAGSTSSSR